ncbi:energy transducer TonB [Saccharicrinis aurantiacus]|uniref:energy transducer TonB n=1 Tax=Saccharicrinis aurantiacus TaxID=1849719 RepID=UPI0024930FD1|nr:energy transducer TonB [Saccharicrinis aurantiacus]
MKRAILLLVVCMGVSLFTIAQEDKSPKVEPVFLGSLEEAFEFGEVLEPLTFREYILENLEYPEDMKNFFVEGVAIVEFKVTEMGTVENVEIVNSLSEACDLAIIEAVNKTNGMWQPAIAGGVSIENTSELSIVFDLQEVESKSYAIKKYAKGVERYNNGDLKGAERLFAQAMRIMPNHPGLVYMKGCVNYENGEYQMALKDFRRVKRLNCSLADHYIPELQAMRRANR